LVFKLRPIEKKTALLLMRKIGHKQESHTPPPPPKDGHSRSKGPIAIQGIQKSGKDTIILMSLGNLVFDGQVAGLIKEKGTQEPFSGVKDILQSGDLITGDLECPLSARGQPISGKTDAFRGIPDAAVSMKSIGLDLVSLANDHVMDYGSDALMDTVDLLDKEGIAHAGAGADEQRAYAPARVRVKDRNITLFAYSAVLPDVFWATSTAPGVAGIKTPWGSIEDQIKKAKTEGDFIIVSFHWGNETDSSLQSYEREYAKKAIDAGADMVIGGHPHVLQGIEIYNSKLIAYSMGDFISSGGNGTTGSAFILKTTVTGGSLAGAEIIPVIVDSPGKPAIAAGDSAAVILNDLRAKSSALGTNINILGSIAEVKMH
jgi:poly-gamma-glutamate synthesis protein (capsule biosynthesis protein)